MTDISFCGYILASVMSLTPELGDIYCEIYAMEWEAQHRQQSFFYCAPVHVAYPPNMQEYPNRPKRKKVRRPKIARELVI